MNTAYALIGEHLSHSFSPLIHKALGIEDYTLIELAPAELDSFLKDRARLPRGFNVTIPYKKAVVPYLDELSLQAKLCGNVNTVLKRPDGTLFGHNTDFDGFLYLLNQTLPDVAQKKVLVLGSGGAGETVMRVLEQKQANAVMISRRCENNYTNLHLHKDASLIVNATPVGMYPHNGESLLSVCDFPRLEGVIDLIYNPLYTRILLEAKKRGIACANGLSMLVAQAKRAQELFLSVPPGDEPIERVRRQMHQDALTIALIGMPSCGKTSVGKALARRLKRPFIDMDEAFLQTYHLSPAQAITQKGEDWFREKETQLLQTLGKRTGIVLATGGGIVEREENEFLLKQNAMLFYLTRPLGLLVSHDRPVSKKNGIEALYKKRKERYESWSDRQIENKTIEQCSAQIEKEFLQ